MDSVGNVFIADTFDNRIRKVDTNGYISTIAGYGPSAADNISAANASLSQVEGVAVDAAGDIFIADSFNNRVCEIMYPGPKLTLNNLNTNNAGNYCVIVSNSFGSVTSAIAQLTIALPPSIGTPPQSQQIVAGTNVVFSVAAGGSDPLSYQWQFNGTNIIGATNATFSIASVTPTNGGTYAAVLSNIYGSITSSVAVLTVLVFPPAITAPPTAQEVHPGSTAMFGVIASGTAPLSYQWIFGGAPLGGQTNSSLALPGVGPSQAGAYAVVVTNAYGSVTSRVAVLVVGFPPVFTTQPTNQSWLVGSRALMGASVAGDGPMTFQWQLNGTNLPNNLITTIAGNGIAGFAGNGGLATTGAIHAPYGVAADNSGNVYLADTYNFVIRKVATNGVMTTVAGRGGSGFSGDGGPATNALINYPNSVVMDANGNVLIADSSNSRIRRVDPTGIITTVAGGAAFSANGGDGGPATNAVLAFPNGVGIDTTGNYFVGDSGNNRLRRIDTNGIISTIAGKSGTGFSGDGGPATNALLNYPQGVAADAAGNVFFADTRNFRVRKVDANGLITTIAGNGSSAYSGDGGAATNAGTYPIAVAVDSYGDVFIADYNNRIRQVDPYGIITTIAGTNRAGYNGDGLVATNAMLQSPNGIALDSYGRFLVADSGNNRIRRFGQGPTLVFDSLAASNAGNYTLIVNSGFGSVTSSVATVTVWLPPMIASPLANQTAGLGSNAAFAVSITGTAPLACQWQMNGTNLPNQTSPSLNLTNVQWSNSGNYRIIVTNSFGSATSSVATLTVGVPPAFSSQPASQMVAAGTNLALGVVMTGDGGFSYPSPRT